jgi:hypothetical protein
MRTIVQSEVYGPICQLIDLPSIPQNKLDLLFAALFLTSIGVFIGANLLLLDVSVLQSSVRVTLSCFALLLIFYALSRSIRNVAWGLVLTYSAMWIMVYSRQPWLVTVVYSAALVALGYVIRFLRVERAYWLPLILMAIIATATILGVEGAYTSFDMLNRLHAGQVHQDTLFHASIAAMIKNYGVVSTGLHGLVETPYHALSHILFAGISLLSGVSVIEVYGVANWVFFAPILIFTIVFCSIILHKTNHLNIPLIWGTVCLLLVVSPRLLWPWGVFDSFFVSESYLVSLGLFLVGFPLLFKQPLSISELLLVSILTALSTYAKLSVGLLLIGLWFARVLFVRSERFSLDVAAFVVSAAMATWTVYHSSEAVRNSIRIFPLHFIVHYSLLGEHLLKTGKALLKADRMSLYSIFLALLALLGFFAFHFLLSWVIIVRNAFRKGIFSVLSNPFSLYSIASVVASSLVVFLFSIPGGSAYYFTNVAFFVALPGVVAVLAYAPVWRRVSSQTFLFVAILLVCLLSVRAFYRSSFMHPLHYMKLHSAFIDHLVEVRNRTPLNVVLQLTTGASITNPVSSCTGQPFVYPAVSERPWIGVIQPRSDCAYEYYGYNQYGITKFQQTVTVPPRLLPGMVILSWP